MGKNNHGLYNRKRKKRYQLLYKDIKENTRRNIQSPRSELSGPFEKELELENNVSSYISILDKLADSDNLIFLDSNVLGSINLRFVSNLYKSSNLLGIYSSAVSYIKKNNELGPCQTILEIMSDFVLFYENFLRKPNIHITTGVADEQLNYIKEIKRDIRDLPIKHNIDSTLKRPLKDLDILISENSQNTAMFGYESNTITEEIFEVLDKIKYHSAYNPSKTDKMLVATACFANLATKKRTYLVSNDKDITFLLSNKREQIKDIIISNNPGAKINIEIESIIFNGSGYYLKRRTGIYR